MLAITAFPNDRVVIGGPDGVWRWDGSAWGSLPGLTGTVNAVHADPSGELVIGGTFSITGVSGGINMARWTDTGAPWIAIQPSPMTSGANANAYFNATTALGYQGISAEWELETGPGSGVFVPISAGTIPGAEPTRAVIISPLLTDSAATARLRLEVLSPVLDQRRIRVRMSNQCGSATSQAVTLRVTVGCSPDLNGDGAVDFNDYLEFLNLFNAASPGVDFNGDGTVDFNDYLEFLNLFNAGC